MRTLLRTLGLSAVLVLAALSSASPSAGTCRIGCFRLGGVYYVSATYEECCSRTIDPCPPGTTPGAYAWGDPPEKCPTF